MKSNEQEIERLLRNAPKPSPPAGLKKELFAAVSLDGPNASVKTSPRTTVSGGWLRRWWPVLIPATASLVGCVVLAFQQIEIREMRESIRKLSETAEAALPETTTAPTAASADDLEAYAAKERAEIAQLRNRVTQLTTEIAGLEAVQKGNEELRTGRAFTPSLSQEEMDAIAAAKEKAKMISCVNNLKQFGLAVRMWQMDNNNVCAPDMQSMSNFLYTPKILYCPSDTNRVAAKTWKDFASSESSYEYLTPSATNADRESTLVLSRCPHHGSVGLCDGSVQMGVGKTHPEGFKTRDGKLYFELP